MDDHRVHPQLGVRSEPDGMSESSSIASIQMCDLKCFFFVVVVVIVVIKNTYALWRCQENLL